MPKPICVRCRCFYSCEKNETFWEEGMPKSEEGQMGHRPRPEDNEPAEEFLERLALWESHWGPYKLWDSDLWKCKSCGHEILIGHANRPWAEHFQADYAEKVARAKPLVRVCDC